MKTTEQYVWRVFKDGQWCIPEPMIEMYGELEIYFDSITNAAEFLGELDFRDIQHDSGAAFAEEEDWVLCRATVEPIQGAGDVSRGSCF